MNGEEKKFLSPNTSKFLEVATKRTDSKISVVFFPATVGAVAWLLLYTEVHIEKLAVSKNYHQSTKLCNNI